jgi:hypothetical protein
VGSVLQVRTTSAHSSAGCASISLADCAPPRNEPGATSSAFSLLVVPGSWPVSIRCCRPPDVDRLLADGQIDGDLSHRTTGSDQIKDLAAGLGGIPLRHGTGDPLGSEDRDHPASRLHPTRGTSEPPDSPGRFTTAIVTQVETHVGEAHTHWEQYRSPVEGPPAPDQTAVSLRHRESGKRDECRARQRGSSRPDSGAARQKDHWPGYADLELPARLRRWSTRLPSAKARQSCERGSS